MFQSTSGGIGVYVWNGKEWVYSKMKVLDEIVKRIDTKGINTMRVGELENKNMLVYHQKGKI